MTMSRDMTGASTASPAAAYGLRVAQSARAGRAAPPHERQMVAVKRCQAWSGCERGLTLMELLVAMTLLGILMTALMGGLRLGTRVWEAGETALRDNSEIQSVRRFLHDRLEETMPMRLPNEQNDRRITFIGAPQTVRFTSTMPHSFDASPLMMQLELREQENGIDINDLVLTWYEFDRGTGLASSEPGNRVILDDVADVSFEYYGEHERREPLSWRSTWERTNALPDLVRLQIAFGLEDGREWPALIVSPKMDLRRNNDDD